MTKRLIELLGFLLKDCWIITMVVGTSNPEVGKVQVLIDYGEEQVVANRTNSYFPSAYSMDRLGDLVKMALEMKKMNKLAVPTLLLISVIVLTIIWYFLRGG